MKTTAITAFVAASFLIAGCDQKAGTTNPTPSAGGPPTPVRSATDGVAQPAISAWQQGDKSQAVESFVEADWSSGPLFTSSSALSLNEDKVAAIPAMAEKLGPELGQFREVMTAVEQAARDAASAGEATQARKYFTALQKCGTALDSADYAVLTQSIGKQFKQKAEAELAKSE